MSTFQVNNDSDLVVVNGRLVLETDPFFAAAIKLRNRFFFFLGEWFLDTREGIPYFELILVKNPSLDIIRRIFTNVILSVSPVIASVTKLDVYFLPGSRECAIEFEAIGADGRKLEGGTGKPFLIQGVPIDGATVDS